MKKLFSTVVITMFLLVAFTGAAFAAQGGMPAAHGVEGPPFGPAFGEAVSDLAQEYPGAVADHVTDDCLGVEVDIMGMPETPGLPAAHKVTGAEFGAAVSAWAQTDPFGLVEHVGGRAPATDYLSR